ncbi:MAG: hypothetical protein ACREYC_27075 [Gammaproteobacteria bacterium]
MSLLVRKCILPLIVYAACLVPAQTHAASFDRASAKTAVEKQICGDILLSVLDDALSWIGAVQTDSHGSTRCVNIGLRESLFLRQIPQEPREVLGEYLNLRAIL